MNTVPSELPGRNEPVIKSRRSTEHEPLPNEVGRVDPPADTGQSVSVAEAARMLAERRQGRQEPVQEPMQEQAEEAFQQEIEEPEALQNDQEDSEYPETDSEQLVESLEETPQPILIGDQEFTQTEIEDGFLRQDDYTRKTQALAEQKRGFENLELQYVTRMGQIDGLMKSKLSQYESINWDQLAQQDPTRYNSMMAMYNRERDKYTQHQQEVDQVMAQIEERKKQDHQQEVEQTTATLRRHFNGKWSNAKYFDLIDFMVDTYKAPRDHLLKATDPVLFQLAADAQAYRQAKTVKPKPAINRSGSRVTSPGRPAQPQSSPQRAEKNAFESLQKTGKIQSAVEAMKARRAAGRKRRPG